MGPRRLTTAAVALALFPACSLLGLDKFQPQRCTEDSQCESLERVSPTGDVCRTWQCNNPEGGDGTCEIRTRDDDGDGAPPPMCAAGAMPDCDDTQPARFPLQREGCNLVDDDCDGVVDPGFGAMSREVASLGAGAGRVTFSRGFTGAEVSVVRVPPIGMVSGLSLGTIAPGGPSALALAPAMTDSAERGVGAHATLDAAGTLLVYDPVMSAARCGAEDTIQARWLRSDGTVAATSCLEQSRLAAVSLTPEPEGDVLLVWVDDAGMRECGSSTEAPVKARVLRPIGGATPRIDTSSVLELGSTADALGPSVAFVPEQGWIVAHVDDGGSIVVHQIAVSTAIAGVTATEISTIAATAAAEVSLSAGRGATIAVAYTEGGCAAANRVVVRTAELAEGSTMFSGELVASPSMARNRRAPVAAYHAARDEWAVVYREVEDESAVRLDAMGRAIGAPTRLGVGTIAGRPYLEALPATDQRPSWGFVTVSTSGVVRSGTFVCLEPT